MVSLEFFIDIIFPAALGSCGRLSLEQKGIPGIFRGGVKAADAYNLTTFVSNVLKSGSLKRLETSEPVQGLLYIFASYYKLLKQEIC